MASYLYGRHTSTRAMTSATATAMHMNDYGCSLGSWEDQNIAALNIDIWKITLCNSFVVKKNIVCLHVCVPKAFAKIFQEWDLPDC